ncbi:MAG: methyl-accepting chemotaxis protein [Clostridiales bacterium]|nr:methyl-accepting chemotaxis protein [Clostridiales bacterium]
MSDLLNHLIATAPLMKKYFQQDVAISISDTEKYVALFETDTMKFPFSVGADIRASGYGEVLERLARTGESITNIVPKEITGTVPIKSIVSPIMEKGQLVGYYSVSINIDKEQHIENLSVELMEAIEKANTAIHVMSNLSTDMDTMMKTIENECISVEDSISQGTKAIDLIQGISSQSNLLGLNAAIEAARVGEAGKSFAIVATEMRNLADECKKISKEVSEALKTIQTTMNTIVTRIKNASAISQDQFLETEKMMTSMDDIEAKSSCLVNYAKS